MCIHYCHTIRNYIFTYRGLIKHHSEGLQTKYITNKD